MKERLVQYLICPMCQAPLTCEITRTAVDLPWKEILEGTLDCLRCGSVYPVHGGIPRFTANVGIDEVSRKTVEGFGYEWSKFNHQISDSYMSQRQNLYDFIHPITAEFFQDKTVLDAGCGMGRFLKLGAEFGSHEIIGIDLSQAVEAAYHNTRHLPNAHVVQGDIMKLPFKPCFDYVFSIGVLQFLPDPRQGFQNIACLVKPGGRVSIWVYSRENNQFAVRFLAPFRKYITSRLPHAVLYVISRMLGILLYATTQVVYRPLNEWKYVNRFVPSLPKNEYLYYSSRLSYHEITSVIFDHLVPQLVVYLSKAELQDWFKDTNMTKVEISSRNNMSWRAHGVVRGLTRAILA